MSPWLEPTLDHLWQSTLFALAAALLVRALRPNRASLRYAVWLAASVKFLIPFAALTAIGERLAWRPAGPVVTPEIAATLGTLSRPFSEATLTLIAPVSTAVSAAVPESGPSLLPALLASLWLAGCLACLAAWYRRWRSISTAVARAETDTRGPVHDTLRRLQRQRDGARPSLSIASVDAPIEPGVFGLMRPVLVWPRGFEDRLEGDQLQALLAHELAHVRRRDNLTMAVHQVVRALCWFNPVVWWIGARLVEERERACDEEVVRLGSAPDAYAEGILRTCRHCVEAPATCAAGVAGGHLRTRIEQIMRGHAGHRLGIAKRLLVVTAGVLLVAGPIAAGATLAPGLAAQSPPDISEDPAFDVVSIRPGESGNIGRGMSRTNPFEGRWQALNTVEGLLSFIYSVRREDVLEGPDWIGNEAYQIQTTYPAVSRETPRNEWEGMLFRMRRRMLVERFGADIREVDREVRGYALRVVRDDGRLGPQLAGSTADCTRPQMSRQQARELELELASLEAEIAREQAAGRPVEPRDIPLGAGCGTYGGIDRLTGRGTTLDSLTGTLRGITGEIVENQTGLEGRYDFELRYEPSRRVLVEMALERGETISPATDGPQFQEHPPIDVALREQLGLELVEADVMTRAIVVERIDRPSPN